MSLSVVRALPPGQRPIAGFPRFGTHLARPAPEVPAAPVLLVRGIVSLDLPLAELAALPRRELTADFHCVAGWSALGLRWEGVPFADFYRTVVEPLLPAAPPVTHVVFRGLDGFRSTLTIEDALRPDVLVAEHLDGRPLDADHGAPVRHVSPEQYGYQSTKHLCRIDVRAGEPERPRLPPVERAVLWFFGRHPRARVQQEERHPSLPTWFVRPVYRAMIRPFLYVGARGGRRTPPG